MRIALAWVDPADPTDRTISENLGRELRRLGHEICFVGPRRRSGEPFRQSVRGFRVYRVGPAPGPAARQLLRLNIREAIDIWHCHVFGRDHEPLVRAARLGRWPMVVTLHLVLHDYLGFLGGKKGLDSLLGCAQHVTLVSRFNRDEFLRLFPGWRGRCSVVPYGAPVSPAGASRQETSRGPYILSVARLAPYKGQDLLLLAFARALDQGIRERLVLCGRDQLRGGMYDFARALHVADRVVFTGELPAARVQRLLQGCAFLALPSRRDNLPLAVLEAMAAGKAVLASAVGGVPELVRHGREGLLVAPNDVEALGRGLLRLCAQPALAKRLGCNALRRSRAFSWRRAAAAYERLFARGLANRRNGSGMRWKK